jgi:superfamily II DNA or RNA helicase
MDTGELIGDIVTNFIRIASKKKAVVFASSVQHSINLKESFEAAGIKAGHIDGETPSEERDLTLKQLESGEIQVLCNCLVLTEGWDCPSAEVCVLARPTKSLGLYLQMVGRVLRPMEGKDEALIIDHSGAVYDHGFVDDEFEWDLDPKKKIQERKKRETKRETKPITCEKCFNVYEKLRACPSCGAVHIKKGRALIVGDGDLGEVDKNSRKAKKKIYTSEEKHLWYSMFRSYAEIKDYKQGWVYHKFIAKFGHKPDKVLQGHSVKEPSAECLSWITHMNIRHSKRKIA